MDSKCPNCGGTEWLPARPGDRRCAKCLRCGQIKLLQIPTVVPSPIPAAKVGAFLLDLFPAADRQNNP
jgi:hypothetical protein